jgi:ABC-type branched-subunit amino acid transport system substrate-binding protein
MVRSRLLFVSVILVAAFFPRMAAAEVLIGVAGPITGWLAWFGEQMERGAEQLEPKAIDELDRLGSF